MPYWVCYYHVVWATKDRAPLITPQNESTLFASIEQQSAKLKSPLVCLNAFRDHVHAAVCIPPSTSVAEWVSKVKGYSSRIMNENYPDLPFQWQGGYGVLTFGSKNLPFVKDYVEHQKEHHQNQTFYAHLEQTDD